MPEQRLANAMASVRAPPIKCHEPTVMAFARSGAVTKGLRVYRSPADPEQRYRVEIRFRHLFGRLGLGEHVGRRRGVDRVVAGRKTCCLFGCRGIRDRPKHATINLPIWERDMRRNFKSDGEECPTWFTYISLYWVPCWENAKRNSEKEEEREVSGVYKEPSASLRRA
ncbi:hypothetical protein C8R47DRAFT_1085208 [Mycena vitilis]|nr:hypothetical protein C8R47DRAFT_1085208 [Mycena vitilis]